MMRCWLKPCPRCRAEYLLEMKQDGEPAVVCPECDYRLLPDEIRFLVEDVVLEMMADRDKSAA
jgi:hypothetical protein